MNDLERQCVTTIRMLAVDQVEQAKSGHPGAPLGMAPTAYTIWDRFLRHNPRDPRWLNRDRFVLSAGHASALLYALLHLTGYDLPLDELRRFRQWGSKTPGHPEYGHTPGVEATTGPLGQGFAMAVGMAIAERYLAERYNRPGFPVIDHMTYVLASDGDLMEGVASEAASLAGHLALGKLVVLYDDNHITIEGDTALAFTEDVEGRFRAYGWHVQHVDDGNDVGAIQAAIEAARAEVDHGGRPSLVRVRTHIGFGSPKQDSAAAHGEPLGPEAARATREFYGWPADQPFYVPAEARRHLGGAVERGGRAQAAWEEMLARYREQYPELSQEVEGAREGRLSDGWDADIPRFSPTGSVATREASGKVINAIAGRLPALVGGAGDLAPSTKTLVDEGGDFAPGGYSGRNLHFGVREHAMAAAVNGMALHGGLVPYGSTFLIFSDYMRPAIRLAALMRARSIFVFTHDSIGVGEDGPTHQPVEQLMSLRLIPGLTVIRPADANEAAEAWRVALTREGPVALALTRQKVPTLDPARHDVAEGVRRGGYVLEDGAPRPDVVLVGTGSELHVALEAAPLLARRGVRARVVSLPSWELFQEQPDEYRRAVLPQDTPVVAVEAGRGLGWSSLVGCRSTVVAVDRFGASAPGDMAMAEYGFTPTHVAERALALLGR